MIQEHVLVDIYLVGRRASLPFLGRYFAERIGNEIPGRFETKIQEELAKHHIYAKAMIYYDSNYRKQAAPHFGHTWLDGREFPCLTLNMTIQVATYDEDVVFDRHAPMGIGALLRLIPLVDAKQNVQENIGGELFKGVYNEAAKQISLGLRDEGFRNGVVVRLRDKWQTLYASPY